VGFFLGFQGRKNNGGGGNSLGTAGNGGPCVTPFPSIGPVGVSPKGRVRDGASGCIRGAKEEKRVIGGRPH